MQNSGNWCHLHPVLLTFALKSQSKSWLQLLLFGFLKQKFNFETKVRLVQSERSINHVRQHCSRRNVSKMTQISWWVIFSTRMSNQGRTTTTTKKTNEPSRKKNLVLLLWFSGFDFVTIEYDFSRKSKSWLKSRKSNFCFWLLLLLLFIIESGLSISMNRNISR